MFLNVVYEVEFVLENVEILNDEKDEMNYVVFVVKKRIEVWKVYLFRLIN